MAHQEYKHDSGAISLFLSDRCLTFCPDSTGNLRYQSSVPVINPSIISKLFNITPKCNFEGLTSTNEYNFHYKRYTILDIQHQFLKVPVFQFLM